MFNSHISHQYLLIFSRLTPTPFPPFYCSILRKHLFYIFFFKLNSPFYLKIQSIEKMVDLGLRNNYSISFIKKTKE